MGYETLEPLVWDDARIQRAYDGIWSGKPSDNASNHYMCSYYIRLHFLYRDIEPGEFEIPP